MRSCVVLTVMAVLAFSTSCGPIFSTYLIVDAESKLAAAKAAEGERYAVYEYTAAEAYIAKANEELGYADYGPAIDYAYKAADVAAQGIIKATDERNKRIDEPGAPPSQNVNEAVEPGTKPAPRKVIIKRLTIPGVPASDPSQKPGPR